MKREEFDALLVENEEVLSWWIDDNEEHIFIKHDADKEECLKIEIGKIPYMKIEEVKVKLLGGRQIDHITRITGYFSKTSGWNKGKTGELKDRTRTGV